MLASSRPVSQFIHCTLSMMALFSKCLAPGTLNLETPLLCLWRCKLHLERWLHVLF
jgi:hypothetical protein